MIYEATKEGAIEFLRDRDEDSLVVTVYAEEDRIVAFEISDASDHGEYEKHKLEWLLDFLHLDRTTLEFVQGSTNDQREELKRLAMIKYHKQQIEKLENEYGESKSGEAVG